MNEFQRGRVGAINLHVLPTKVFKTFAISLYAGIPLAENTVTPVALTPFVLRRGTASTPETIAFREKLDDLYGAGFGFDVYKRGDAQIVQFRMDVINDQFVSASQSLLAEALAFLGDVVSEPLLEDGKFRSSYVESEKETLRNRLQAIVNDKIRYSAERCVEEMCKNEPYRLQALGRLDDIAGISPEALYQNYSAWLDHAAFDLYVAGDTTLEEVAELAGKAFKLKPRQPGAYGAPDKGYSIKETNYVVEEMDVNQGKLNMGLRTGITYGDNAYAAMLMYNGILGGYPHSKLFRNVREKESLAYYASSRLDGHKGICAIQSGIEFQNYDKALEIITEQLASMSKGELSDLEMNQTKAMIMGHLREIQDSAYEMIAYDFNGVLSGNLRTRDELMAQIAAITPEDVAEVGKHVRLETVYFLRNRKEA